MKGPFERYNIGYCAMILLQFSGGEILETWPIIIYKLNCLIVYWKIFALRLLINNTFLNRLFIQTGFCNLTTVGPSFLVTRTRLEICIKMWRRFVTTDKQYIAKRRTQHFLYSSDLRLLHYSALICHCWNVVQVSLVMRNPRQKAEGQVKVIQECTYAIIEIQQVYFFFVGNRLLLVLMFHQLILYWRCSIQIYSQRVEMLLVRFIIFSIAMREDPHMRWRKNFCPWIKDYRRIFINILLYDADIRRIACEWINSSSCLLRKLIFVSAHV